jgi:hypothetical protein
MLTIVFLVYDYINISFFNCKGTSLSSKPLNTSKLRIAFIKLKLGVVFMDKKGQMGGGRKAFSIILGLIFLVLGAIPLLNYFNVISFSLPRLPMIVLSILALAGAIMLIVDGFKEEQGFTGATKAIGIASIIIALVLVVAGLLLVIGAFAAPM